MIGAALGDLEVAWDNGVVTVQRDVLAGSLEGGPIARAGLAADCLRLQADVERRMSEVAYDPAAFDLDDRPFRVRPGLNLAVRAMGVPEALCWATALHDDPVHIAELRALIKDVSDEAIRAAVAARKRAEVQAWWDRLIAERRKSRAIAEYDPEPRRQEGLTHFSRARRSRFRLHRAQVDSVDC